MEIGVGALARAHTLGEGRVALVEFSDYECPFCASFARVTFPRIARQLVEGGVGTYVAFNYPIEAGHPLAVKAAEAAECAGRQDGYWEMRERLFASSPDLAEGKLAEMADELGLDGEAFRRCLREGETEAVVRAHIEEGERLGVSGTPTFLVGEIKEGGTIEVRQRLRARCRRMCSGRHWGCSHVVFGLGVATAFDGVGVAGSERWRNAVTWRAAENL